MEKTNNDNGRATDDPQGELKAAFRFEELPEALRRAVADLGWEEPMEVQTRAIPIIRGGGDLITQSRTGSGKTGAFLIPLLVGIDPRSSSPQALVLTPTRELAIQVHGEFRRLAGGMELKGALIYGGVGYRQQLKDLKDGAQIVIGTPGRVLDHFDRGTLKPAGIRHLVLDEADEMLSMGFYPAMRKIRRWIPHERQSLMFSATMPRAVVSLSREFLKDPEFLSLSGDHIGVETLKHESYVVQPMEKDRALVRLVEMENPSNALIFCNRKSDVEYLYQFMQNAGYDVDRISGDLSQRAREKVMNLIRERRVRYLVATDVAARGIDISDLEIVFQYDVPQDHEIYIHRSGRTARAGKSGKCITLATYMDEHQLRQIQQKFKVQIEQLELPDLEAVSQRVRERLVVLLEEEMRDAGSILNERIDRFMRLAAELAETEEGRRLVAMLLDGHYHRSLHLPPRLPQEKIRFEEIEDRPAHRRGRRPRHGGEGGQEGRDRSSERPARGRGGANSASGKRER